MFCLRILHMRHQGISVFVAREGHCRLSELRRRSEGAEGSHLRSDSEARVGCQNLVLVEAVWGDPDPVSTAEPSAWSPRQCPVLWAGPRSELGTEDEEAKPVWMWNWSRAVPQTAAVEVA